MTNVILITGASSGIGAATARRMAREASAMLLHARSSGGKLEAVADEIRAEGVAVETRLGDLTQPGVAAGLVAACESAFGRLDGLVANAGFPILASLEEGTLEDIESAFRGNLFSFFELAKAARAMLARAPDPRIVALGSFTSHVFRTDIHQFPISAASKGALETAVRSLAQAFAPERITVNCVVPGFVRKEAGTEDGVDPAEEQAMISRIPLGRLGDPGDIAAAIAFLLSPAAGYITGQSLHVNGGLI